MSCERYACSVYGGGGSGVGVVEGETAARYSGCARLKVIRGHETIGIPATMRASGVSRSARMKAYAGRNKRAL